MRHVLGAVIMPQAEAFGDIFPGCSKIVFDTLPLGAIRELIPRLEAEGLIRTIPQRGMSIAEVDPKLVKDAFEFRLFLEIQAVKYFTKHASDNLVGKLLNETKDIIALCELEDSSDIFSSRLIADAQTVDWKLHEQIIKTLNNKIIIDAYRVNAIKIRLIKLEQTSLTQANVISTMKEHLDIIHAVQLRDPAAAEKEIVKHIENARFRALTN
jgi:DNA-binding GntR family transcriptional regulator